MGEELTQENNTEVRWTKYFVQLLNNDKISELGGDVRVGRIRGNEIIVRKVIMEEIRIR